MAGVRIDEGAPARRSLWALVDQGVISLGTFLTSIQLARILSQREFGIYGVLLGFLLFANGVHASLITYPLSVKGAVESAAGLRRQGGASLTLTTVLAGVLCVACLPFTVLLADRPWLAPLGFAALLLGQWQETLRRTLFAGLRVRAAVWGDAASYLGQAVLIGLVALRRPVSLEIALGLMTLTSMLAAAIQAVQVQPEAVDVQEVRRQARAFWQPGRLILASSLMNLLTINGFFWILALRSGAESAASFQAAMNLLGVSHPLLFSVGNVILPSAARANHTAGWKGACRCAWKHSAQLGVLLFVFFGILAARPRDLLSVLYGAASPYVSLSTAVRLLVPAYVFAFGAQVLKALLASVEDAKAILSAQIAAAVVSVAAGLPLAAWRGVNGACAGLALVNLALVLASLAACLRRIEPVPASWHRWRRWRTAPDAERRRRA